MKTQNFGPFLPFIGQTTIFLENPLLSLFLSLKCFLSSVTVSKKTNKQIPKKVGYRRLYRWTHRQAQIHRTSPSMGRTLATAWFAAIKTWCT